MKKNEYVAPELKELGSLVELTAQTSGSADRSLGDDVADES